MSAKSCVYRPQSGGWKGFMYSCNSASARIDVFVLEQVIFYTCLVMLVYAEQLGIDEFPSETHSDLKINIHM